MQTRTIVRHQSRQACISATGGRPTRSVMVRVDSLSMFVTTIGLADIARDRRQLGMSGSRPVNMRQNASRSHSMC